MGKIVRFYQTEDGKTPFKDFKEIERAETCKRDYMRGHKRHE